MIPLYKCPNVTRYFKVNSLFRSLIVVLLFVSLASPGLAFDRDSRDRDRDEDTKKTHDTADVVKINLDKWGEITAPVYGTAETGAYAGAELFAGPNKFGSYFAGVLPNGRLVKPAGISAQVGMNPLGAILTSDGKFLITSNDDERESKLVSYQNSTNVGFYSLSVVDTAGMKVVSNIAAGPLFIGLQVTGTGPYTLWASGGPDNNVKIFNISATGVITADSPANITITPITPGNQGFVSNYTPDTTALTGKPVPSGFNTKTGAQTTFPAGSALSQDGRFLYVACNGDNSIAVIDTTSKTVVKQLAVGYFPYGVSISADGQTVSVSNWGITEYRFKNPTYDAGTGKLTALASTGNEPDGFYVPATNPGGLNPKTSSVSILSAPGGDGSKLSLIASVYQGHELDDLSKIGDTHPSATAIVRKGKVEVLYVTKSNSDSLGAINLATHQRLDDFDLSPVKVDGKDERRDDWKGDRDSEISLHGAYPNAIIVSPDNKRMYVAEAGLNSVAVLDTTDPNAPKLLGRIPTGWYPTALALGGNGRYLYVANAKGVGEDINSKIVPISAVAPPTGIASDPSVDSNFIFGSVQKVDLHSIDLDGFNVLANNLAKHSSVDDSVVPIGDHPSRKIKHVFFILHENKTFDSMLGNLDSHFAPYASLVYNNRDGSQYTNGQFTGVSVNTQLLAGKFATAVNYYSESEESDAGHQYCASGTATDYTEKTLLVKGGRGLLVNKNFEPEDYPENGYIFNNAARHGVSFKDYGAMVRIEGTDTGTSTPTTIDDPKSGKLGYPKLAADNFSVTDPLVNAGDVTSATQGLGQSYFLQLPILAVLGENNSNGEPRLDTNYPGYNFNISDQRRAQEFIQDFDRMVSQDTLPEFIYIYQPNDHTGSIQATNNSSDITNSPLQQVADCDVGLGMVVEHIMKSPVYYDKKTGEGSAIFITYDDAQSSLDHIHPHRTPLIVISPYAKPGYLAKRHYSTASIVKTEELLLGLPPNNLGDLFATDLRDLFQPTYNKIEAKDVAVTKIAKYTPSKEGKRIWSLVKRLDTSAPDRDSYRLGALARLSIRADDLHSAAKRKLQINSQSYKTEQANLFETAQKLVSSSAPRDADD